MRLLLIHLLLALAWMALTGQFTAANFAVGLVLAFPILWLTQRGKSTFTYLTKIRLAGGFAAFFLWELLKANLRVAHDVLTLRHHMRPGVIAVPLDQASDLEILVLTTFITLTPGTLSLDVSTDKRTLYIHAMYIDDMEQFRESIKQGYEKRVREVLQ
ncbi:MAG: Na+/H+ antiporter subunit E [Deltaproteobacteria bacterium]|nr:Na+/H+ antiporter subunit E [Deltaproteobacteria bacterium]TLN04313.1 MAG: Na+/H+ antiporter subunit E [bacterium]